MHANSVSSTDFFHLYNGLRTPNEGINQRYLKKWADVTKFLHVLWVFRQDLELQAALTGRKKPVLGQKKAANNFFDADHHFETHKIGFKDFDQQWDVPKRGLEPVN